MGFQDSPDLDVGEITQIVPIELNVPPRILLVDDDPLVLGRLELLLQEEGFEVQCAESAAGALAAMERDFSPVVILDRNMPQMDGFALCRAIRARQWPGYVYLMLLTAQDSEEDVLGGLRAGADDYLSKRASHAQLVARLHTARRVLSLELSLKTALQERRRLSLTDALTRVYNRRYFMEHLEQALREAQPPGKTLALLALDIDHFKQINDRYGHAAGDTVLQEFSRRIRNTLPREEDWCARLGGEEFAVVLPHTTVEEAVATAESLRAAVAAKRIRVGANKLMVTMSVGGVLSNRSNPTEEGAATERLLERADQCLYRSKESGRNRVTFQR